MEMLVLIGLVIAGFILVSMVMPWINMARIRGLEAELARLRSGISASDGEQSTQDIGVDLTEKNTPWKELSPVPLVQKVQAVQKPKLSDSSWADDLVHHLSTKFPVWIGGIALALAGFSW